MRSLDSEQRRRRRPLAIAFGRKRTWLQLVAGRSLLVPLRARVRGQPRRLLLKGAAVLQPHTVWPSNPALNLAPAPSPHPHGLDLHPGIGRLASEWRCKRLRAISDPRRASPGAAHRALHGASLAPFAGSSIPLKL